MAPRAQIPCVRASACGAWKSTRPFSVSRASAFFGSEPSETNAGAAAARATASVACGLAPPEIDRRNAVLLKIGDDLLPIPGASGGWPLGIFCQYIQGSPTLPKIFRIEGADRDSAGSIQNRNVEKRPQTLYGYYIGSLNGLPSQ
ncbi:MAG: hypothetical protein OXN84_05750 [Albidovulum sp.]|nr:hypothetical protein [Albidovulum sp.]